jgi:hypothetical protein
VLKNEDAVLPIKNLDKQKIAYVKIGDDTNDALFLRTKKYAEVTVIADSNLIVYK